MNRAIVAGFILGAALVSGGMLIQSGGTREAGAAPASPRLFEQVMERVRRDYIDTVSTEQMLRLAAGGVVQEVDERYSMLLTPERAARLRETASGRYAGIGIELDIRDGFVTVIAPIAGTPADSAGIEPGDRIVSVDGKSTYRLTMEEVQQALRGPSGSKVELGIDREEDSRKVVLTRRMIVSHPVRRAEVLAPGTAYVRLATFSEQAAVELRSYLEGPGRSSSLILDLRENPGGLFEQGIEVAELFLDPGQTIVRTRGRTPEMNRDYADQSRQRWPTMPIVLLVDSGTASAAEIVGGALQDNKRAVLVGSPTYGKGSAQSLFPVTSGYALKLTTARWLTPNGRAIERDSTNGGLEPDVVVRKAETGRRGGQHIDSTRRAEPPLSPDPVVQRALQLLQGVKTPSQLRARVPAKPRKPD